MVGQQQTTLPLLAEQVFTLTGYSYVFAYVAAFGISKAAFNYLAGVLSDRHGRKPVLLGGWLLGLPVPLLIMWAPTWEWIIIANILLGANQGLAWSTTVTMKIDLVGPRQRGLAMGLNEAAGYLAVSLTSLAAGLLAAQYGLRPAPILLGVAYAILALVLVTFFVRETREFTALETPTARADLSNGGIIADVTWRHPALSSASVAGMANNLNFGLSWGVFPLLFAGAGTEPGTDRPARGALPARVGTRAAGRRLDLRPHRPQTPRRRRHGTAGGRPGGHRLVGGDGRLGRRHHTARPRIGHGLPGAPRRHR